MVRAYEAAFKRFEACLAAQQTSCRAPAPMNTQATFAAAQPAAGAAPGAPVVTVTPQAAAHMAMAKLTLTPPTPGIGPPPKINEWKMAAVGYPLWLWGEGDLDPGPVSDAVAGLSVRLDPQLNKIVFSMGDGESVTCRNAGTAWTRAVEPGAESPTCGYRYQKPSLPKGNYTVTAHTHWAVNWSINGVTGSIPMVQEAATELPVGELQALVR